MPSTGIIESVIDRLPNYYDKDNTSQVYNLIHSIVGELENTYTNYINRLDNCLNIDTTTGTDLDWKWGNLLNVARRTDESDSTYRKRLSGAMSSLSGGTAKSIQYAVAIFLGLADDEEKSARCIKIYDGWRYELAEPGMDTVGHIICVFSLDKEDTDIYYDGIEADIVAYMDNIKVAGVEAHVMVEFATYDQVSNYTYDQLATMTYDQIRKWGV
jgi:hypothetical protein